MDPSNCFCALPTKFGKKKESLSGLQSFVADGGLSLMKGFFSRARSQQDQCTAKQNDAATEGDRRGCRAADKDATPALVQRPRPLLLPCR